MTAHFKASTHQPLALMRIVQKKRELSIGHEGSGWLLGMHALASSLSGGHSNSNPHVASISTKDVYGPFSLLPAVVGANTFFSCVHTILITTMQQSNLPFSAGGVDRADTSSIFQVAQPWSIHLNNHLTTQDPSPPQNQDQDYS